MAVTLALIDGFEHGTATAASAGIYGTVTGSPAIVTTPVRSGLRALEISTSAAAENVQNPTSTAPRYVASSFYVRLSSLPAADCYLSWNENANGSGFFGFSNADSKFAIWIAGAAKVVGGPTISAGVWYRVDMEFDTSTGTASVKCRIDGGDEFSTTRSQTAADITQLCLGTNTTHTYTAYFDDWVASVTTGDYPIGPHAIESLIPSADGSHNIATSGDFDSFSTTQFSNSTTNGYTFIAHRPMQRANTNDQVIRQELGSQTDYMEFAMEDVSAGYVGASVLAVRSYACWVESANPGHSQGEIRLLLSDNTEVLTTGSLSVIEGVTSPVDDPGTTVTTRKRMFITPSGGWSTAIVNGCKARVGFGDNSPDVNFIDFMIEVCYGPISLPFQRRDRLHLPSRDFDPWSGTGWL